ncbi:MAG: hypothetical protein IPG83_11125 [Novosphingobium sp.]|nr:hypothetical protein [Novosphingobium sp.]
MDNSEILDLELPGRRDKQAADQDLAFRVDHYRQWHANRQLAECGLGQLDVAGRVPAGIALAHLQHSNRDQFDPAPVVPGASGFGMIRVLFHEFALLSDQDGRFIGPGKIGGNRGKMIRVCVFSVGAPA